MKKVDTWYEHWLGGVGVHHCVTFNFGSANVCSPGIFVTSFSHDKDIRIAATDYYIPRRKSGIYWIQVRCAAAAVEISLWTR